MGSKFKKIIICFILTLTLVICGVSVVALADDSGAGYKYDSTTNTLTITSDEAMRDYTEDTMQECPWYYYKGAIKSVVIDDGVTKIGDYDFSTMDNLDSVDIPDSVKSIGEAAFAGCNRLKALTISDEVKSIGENAFGFNAEMTITDGFVCYVGQGSVAQKYCLKNYIPFDYGYQNGMQEVSASNGEQIIWSFVPRVDGKVTFYSTGRYDTYGVIYDSNTYMYSESFNQMLVSALASNDDNGSNLNFMVTANLKAGVRYYLATRLTITNQTGTYKVYMDFECDESSFVETSCTATCTEPGIRYYECEYCGVTKAEEVPALGHRYVETRSISPTCTEDGQKDYECEACKDTYYEAVDALGHDEIVDRLEPTCTEDGYIDTTCSRCDYHNYEVLDALGHSYTDYRVSPTCTEDGFYGSICTRCENTEGSVVPANGHSIKATYDMPTCTKGGSITYTCSRCDYIDVIELVPSAHIYKLNRTEYPTCTEEGRNYYKCKNCDAEYSEPIAPYGHNYCINRVDDNEDGIRSLIVYTCTRCEDEYTDDFSQYINMRFGVDYHHPYDMNSDGIINAKDYAILISTYF